MTDDFSCEKVEMARRYIYRSKGCLPVAGSVLFWTVFYLVIPGNARAQTTDEQELFAIKAEMHRLEAQVEAIERRHRKNTPLRRQAALPAHNPQTASVEPAVAKASTITVKTPRRLTPDILPLLARPDSPAQFSSGASRQDTRTAEAPFLQWTGHVRDEPHRTAIDLSSSSPLAITQTAVDQLPPIFRIGNISVRLGGFVDMSNIWRSSNLTSGPATAWNNFPYANSPNHGLPEERLSAQLTRFSTLLEANPTPSVRLQSYIEADFGGSAATTNSVQISGYTPRLRQGYFTFTQKKWGLHVLMGQAWSLTTNYAKGVIPRQEQLPAVTDNNQIPGITFTRVPQIRIGKDWSQKYWLALSIEDPQATFAFSKPFASGDYLPAAYGQTVGARSFYANSGGVLLNPNSSYTYNPAPDIVLKGAVDTSFGHYEVFGLARWFRALVEAPGATRTHKSTSFGGGVGAGMTMPLGTRALQLTGNVLAGQGVGRYGPSLIPDTTLNGQGSLSPVPEMMGSLGLIGHPTSSVLLYTYGGVEAAGRSRYIGADGHQYGYGVTDTNLAGCSVEFGTCDAQTRTLASFTAGGWWHFLEGHYGSLMGGLQYTYIRKFAFKGNDGAGHAVDPTTFGHTVYVTFRYFPFQQ